MPSIPASPTFARTNAAPALASMAQFDAAGQCVLGISATVELGPNVGQSFQGTLSISLGADGAIDAGTMQFSDGTSVPVVGQATGRSLRLRIGTDSDTVITLVGSGVVPVEQCSGDLSGAFTGPGVQNVGVWIATGTTGA